MKHRELVEEVAEIIFLYEGGTHPDEYKEITGEDQRHWKKRFSFHKEENCLEMALLS